MASTAAVPNRVSAASCMDYLQTEVVTMLQRRAEELQLGPEAHAVQLEALGFSVGQKLAERMVKERAPFQTLLDVIKFIGREFWTEVFKKQLDKLQTNHNGVFVMHDKQFRYIKPYSNAASEGTAAAEVKEIAQSHLYLPCGLIRGAMHGLGVVCDVTANISAAPACAFTVRIPPT